MSNKSKGETGESLAAACLIAKGYKIVKRNYRGRTGEIDIIAIDGPTRPKRSRMSNAATSIRPPPSISSSFACSTRPSGSTWSRFGWTRRTSII